MFSSQAHNFDALEVIAELRQALELQPKAAPRWIQGSTVYQGRESIAVYEANEPYRVIAVTGLAGTTDQAESVADASLIAVCNPTALKALLRHIDLLTDFYNQRKSLTASVQPFLSITTAAIK